MAAVAVLAVAFAAVRAESAPTAGAAIIGTCVCYLGHNRYSAAVTQRHAGGLATNRWQTAGLLLSSAAFAGLVIGLSDVAFLTGYYGYLKVANELVVESHWTPYDDPGYMATAAVIGVFLALSVASSLRRAFRRPEASLRRRWLHLWPIGLAVVLGTALVAEEMRQRYRFCRMMTEYHAAGAAQTHRPKKAAFHAWLKRWYERASVRPWMPIHRDRIPAGLDSADP